MSMLFGSPERPAPPPLPAPLPNATPPSYASGANKGPAGNSNKIPSGMGATLLTSPLGGSDTGTNTGKKSLLGQ